MSEEKINSEDVFEREMRLSEDFHYYGSTNEVLMTSFNISSGETNWFIIIKIGMLKE